MIILLNIFFLSVFLAAVIDVNLVGKTDEILYGSNMRKWMGILADFLLLHSFLTAAVILNHFLGGANWL